VIAEWLCRTHKFSLSLFIDTWAFVATALLSSTEGLDRPDALTNLLPCVELTLSFLS
jgi:hypothetical protein